VGASRRWNEWRLDGADIAFWMAKLDDEVCVASCVINIAAITHSDNLGKVCKPIVMKWIVR